MDPNATLAELRANLAKIRERKANFQTTGMHVADLLDQIEALDGWLSKGGFPPDAWTTKGGPT